MNKTKLFYLIFTIFSFFSCREDEKIVRFKNETTTPKLLKGDTIRLPSTNKVLDYTILKDSIVLVNYWATNDSFLVDVFNLKSTKLLNRLAKNGADDGLFLSAVVQYRNTSNNYFSIKDGTKQVIAKYYIDSLLEKKTYKPVYYKFPSFQKDVDFFSDDSLLIFNSYYLEINGKPLNQKSDSPLLFLKTNSAVEATAIKLDKFYSPKYFTTNVSGSTLLVNPNNHDIWLLDDTFDKISIFNNKKQLVKCLYGDGTNAMDYAVHESNNSVFYKDKKYYRSYYPSVCTKNNVYLLYIGIKGIDLNKTRIERPCFILKMDWNGNLKKVFKTNEYLYKISISNDEKTLYGTSVKEFGKSAYLLKYKLN